MIKVVKVLSRKVDDGYRNLRDISEGLDESRKKVRDADDEITKCLKSFKDLDEDMKKDYHTSTLYVMKEYLNELTKKVLNVTAKVNQFKRILGI